MDRAHAYALGWKYAHDIRTAKRNAHKESCIENKTKSENVSVKDIELAYAMGCAWARGFAYATKHNLSVKQKFEISRKFENTPGLTENVNQKKTSEMLLNSEDDTTCWQYFNDIIAEDRFVTLYTKTGRPYPCFFDELSEEEKTELDKNPVTGGRYDYVKYCTDGSVHDVHHIISAEALKATGLLSYNTAPCIRMLKSDHKKTKSHGHYKSSADYRKKQIELINRGRIKDVIMEEINNIRSLFGSKYDKEIREMLKYVNKLENNDWVA